MLRQVKEVPPRKYYEREIYDRMRELGMSAG